MQKKVSLSTLIIAVVIAVSITFTFTFGAVQIANSLADVIGAIKASSSVGKEIDKIQELLPEDKRNPELFETLAFIDYFYQTGYIDEVDTDELKFYLMNAYISYVGDKYGMYYTPEMVDELFSGFQGVKSGLGVYIKSELENDGIKIFAVMNNSPAERAGLLAGDIIFEVDGQLVKDLGYEVATDMLLGELGTEVKLGIMNTEGFKRSILVKRESFEAQTVFYHKYSLDNTAGVVRILEFNENTPAQFKDAVNALLEDGCQALIFDVRSNTGGTLDSCLEMLDFLLPKGIIARITDANGASTEVYYSEEGEINVPMAVLTDGYTASAAELFTCALMDYNKAVIVGTKTYGKGCMQNVFELPCGGALRYTTNLFNGPTSPNFDGVGITPDVVVELDEALLNKSFFEITDEEDNQLKGAYEALLNQ